MDSTSDPYITLASMRRYSERVFERLQVLPTPRDAASNLAVRRVITLAQQLYSRARKPISIGLVGEYSVGKSSLLSALLGQPNLLRSSTARTTGNITAIRVRELGPDETPGPPDVSVSYLSRDECAHIADYLMRELMGLVKREQLRYDVTALRGYNPVRSGWQTFEAVARTWWSDNAGAGRNQRTNLEHLRYSWELLKLRNALDRGRELIAESRPSRDIPIKEKVIKDAVEIGGIRKIPLKFPELPVKAPFPAETDLTAPVLGETFPLIRRVTYEVAIVPGLWNISGLRYGNTLEFLDFPGLNAFGASRDEYLCRQELRQLTSFLEVLDARRPETGTASKFATILEGRRCSGAYLRESVLLAANWFDKVEPVQPRSGQMSLREFVDSSADLGSLYRTLGDLSQQRLERIALTSAVKPQRNTEWAVVAEALEAGSGAAFEARETAATLRAYMADGGLSRLREMLSEHIRIEVLPIEIDELTAMRAELRNELIALRALLEPTGAHLSADGERELLSELLDELSNAIVELRVGASIFRDPQALEVVDKSTYSDGSATRTGLLDVIRGRAVMAVYGWGEWSPLLLAVREGQISRSAAENSSAPLADASTGQSPAKEFGDVYGTDDFRDLASLDRATDMFANQRDVKRQHAENVVVKLPDSTADFEARFFAELAELRRAGRQLALDVIAEWANEREERFVDARRQMQRADVRRLLSDRLASLDRSDGGIARLSLLNAIIDLRWVGQLFTRILTHVEEQTAAGGANAYPLAANQALAWYEEYDPPAAPADMESLSSDDLLRQRHHSAIHRIRHDLAEGLAFPVQSAVATAFGSLAVQLEARLEALRSAIPAKAELLSLAASKPIADNDTSRVADLIDDLINDS